MTAAMRGLLYKDEQLMYPVHGVFVQREGRELISLALLDDSLIVAVEVAGQTLSIKKERIPLDAVKSVTIKKRSILRMYELDISFTERAPMRIMLPFKMRLAVSQSDNLPQFIDRLRSRAKEQPALREAVGEKIRRQYFNVLILLMFFTVLCMMLMFTVVEIVNGTLCIDSFLELITTSGGIFLMFFVPLAMLSLLNRFTSGESRA